MSDTPVRDERTQLLAHAQQLIALLHETNAGVNRVVNELIAEADRMLPVVANEREGLTPTQRRQVKMSKATAAVPQAVEAPPKLAPGKRACSICRKPGHRAQNCPTAQDPDFHD